MSRQTGLSKPIQVVALVLINDQGDILVQQRQSGKHLAGLWEFPGGKVEEGETLSQALTREIQEELGHQIKTASHLTTLTHSYSGKDIELTFFIENVNKPQVKAQENQPLQWVSAAQLKLLAMPEANLPIIDLFIK